MNANDALRRKELRMISKPSFIKEFIIDIVLRHVLFVVMSI